MATLIKNHLPRIFGFAKARSTEPVLFKPGVNSVSDKDLKAIQDNPHFESALERRDLSLLSPTREEEAKDASEELGHFDISSVNVNEAAGIIGDTLDVTLLRSWADEDDRATVRRAIRKQIETIEKAGKKEE